VNPSLFFLFFISPIFPLSCLIYFLSPILSLTLIVFSFVLCFLPFSFCRPISLLPYCSVLTAEMSYCRMVLCAEVEWVDRRMSPFKGFKTTRG
jgi:hypothetical protein